MGDDAPQQTVESKLDEWMDHLERQYEKVQEFRAAVNKELRGAETAYFLLKVFVCWCLFGCLLCGFCLTAMMEWQGLVSHTYYEQKTQEEQSLPSEYFRDLAHTFEKVALIVCCLPFVRAIIMVSLSLSKMMRPNKTLQRMQECRQRIDELELYLSSARNPRPYTPKMLQDIVDNQVWDFFCIFVVFFVVFF